MATGPDDPQRIELERQWDLRRDAGRVLAAALARLIEAYESSPDRARHALSWEHLPGRVGSPRPISERGEASAGKSSESAKRVIQTAMLHDGKAPLSEYAQLLDDWYLISDRSEEDSFKLDEYLGSSHSNWAVTGEGLIPSEQRRLHGWSVEDVERLRSRDPELLREYRQELEKAAITQNIGWKDREIWIEARLADIDSAVETKILDARTNDLDAQLSRWMIIEKLRNVAAENGRLYLWAETPVGASPEVPVVDKRKFPDFLTPEMRHLYETTEKKQTQAWQNISREVVDEYEALVDQLVTLSKELPTTPEVAKFMALKEEGRAGFDLRFGPRVPIPTDYGWYEYCSLDMDDEAEFGREIEDDVRKSGNLWIHWAKELVGMLPIITRRAVELGKHPISDISKDGVPESLRVLFEHAHMLYLFDFDIPCVLTCGALVEELVEKEFPQLNTKWSLQQTKWESKVSEIVSQFPRYENAGPYLVNIMSNRNVAAHDPSVYLGSGRSRSENILRMTRSVLETFYETANSQAEGN
jgi:hypothetical protein